MQALRTLCSERDGVLGGIVTHYGLVGSPALGETARDVAKGLPIWLLHGGSHAAWLAAHGLMEEHPVLPLMARLEKVPARHAICLGARPQSTTTTPRHHLARTHTKAQPSRLRMKVQPETCSLIYVLSYWYGQATG